jgi:hypothetical protein
LIEFEPNENPLSLHGGLEARTEASARNSLKVVQFSEAALLPSGYTGSKVVESGAKMTLQLIFCLYI